MISSIRTQIGGVFLTILLTGPTASAGIHCQRCRDTGMCEEMVAVTVTEMKTVEETCYRDEQQVKTVLVPKVIQVEKQVPYEYTAWVRVKKEDPQELEIKTPKFRWVDQKYTITVPGKDTVTKIRKRTEMVPTIEMCTVTEDHGYFETKMVATKTCGGCLCTEKKVWCPCPVEVLKEKTVMKPVTIEEPYTCEVDICVPIEKTRRVKEYFTKTEKKVVKNPYTTLEPRKRTKMVTAFVPETVHEEKTEICTIKVPYTVFREVPCQVTRMVPKQQACSCQSH
ncbi:hypothetical protein [Novipirellula artificiosorum]|uniref:Uncharacterized protein n=1 Tax=Novipirellula artificiosorum TaxID=2528016 RepID=A0A5C6CCQ5_9BACT|nr:hypothetical protein [Novipirellula artificiosorum]TWU21988.1 hypothetical protein Poly41_71270 [Novipirellula artificiosorum]